MPLDLKPTTGITRPVAGAAFAALAVVVLVQDPPHTMGVWVATAAALAAAGFAIWRLDVPSYSNMDRARLRVQTAGNVAILATCCVTAYICAVLLPSGPALAAAAGFSCAAVLAAVRLSKVVDARRRFTVWRR